MKSVFVSGNFNILHHGHLRLLRFAKDLGSVLIIGVNSDEIGGIGVHVPLDFRLDVVRSNTLVDKVVLIDKPIEDIILNLKPDFVVKGKEHEGLNNPEDSIVKKYGGKLVFSSGEVIFSSLDLVDKGLSSISYNQVPKDFARRHTISFEKLNKIVEDFSKIQVCIIGDLIVDEYISCDPLGMSQEDPTIVVKPVKKQRFIGGAGIVAAHAAGLGAKVNFFSVTGIDEVAKYARSSLSEFGVKNYLYKDESRPTTLKQRFRANDKTLLRVNSLHQGVISKTLQERILVKVKESMQKCQLLVFSDYNYGCLPQTLVDQLIDYGKKLGLIMVADSQCSSQIGNISRFRNMDLLTPTEREARICLRNQEDGLVVLCEKLKQEAKTKNIILKLGSEGVLLYFEESSRESRTDRIPALNSLPIDTSGAGDSVLITSSLAIASGASPWEAACLASKSAAVQVSRLGNIPLIAKDLITHL
ncbi:PfkB family carbohydrate kinase [Opitutales bacterium]|jgi:rfaE bifunctional protein kinase chain/domain|nr:PfkB family carbohydrate kinase [Opitutales bacterium]